MENWRDELPDNLKTNETLARYETAEDAYQGLIEANSMLGRSITIPSEDAGEDARTDFVAKLIEAAPNLTFHPDHADDHGKEFWSMLGVPGEAKEYKPAEDFEGLPDDYVESLRANAKAAGLTNKQFQATLVEYAREYEEQATAVEEAKAADAAIIANAWGNAEQDKKDAIAALIGKLEDPDNKVGELNAAGYLLMDKIVEAFTGKGAQIKLQPQGTGAMTPEEINDELSIIDARMIKEGTGMPQPTWKRLMAKKEQLLKLRAA